MYFNEVKPKIIAFELTSKCNLLCKHCRIDLSIKNNNTKELTKDESFNLIDQLCVFGSPIIILTGGEPLLCPWSIDLIKYGTSKGLKMALATNGTLITREIAFKLKKAGVKRVSISLDGTKDIHDSFRCVEGSFYSALIGIKNLKEENIEFQINTTVSKYNIQKLEDIYKFVISIGAVAHHFFFLVTTGKAINLNNYELSSLQYENILTWLYKESEKKKINIHPTCAPHYLRIKKLLEFKNKDSNFKNKNLTINNFDSMDTISKGCLCGSSFVFISSTGEVNPCGYLHLSSGNIKNKDFLDIWTNSEIFKKIRNPNNYSGKCGVCEFKFICGGCRARAYAATGDYLSEEPFCLYIPKFY